MNIIRKQEKKKKPHKNVNEYGKIINECLIIYNHL